MTRSTRLALFAFALLAPGCAQRPEDAGPGPYAARPGDPTLTGGALVTARSGHTATAVPGGVLVTGGATLQAGATADAELVDPRSGVSLPLPARMTCPRRGHVAASVAGGVLLLGGADADGAPLDSVERWDAGGNRFERLDVRLRAPRAFPAAARAGDRLVLAGGDDGGDTLEVWSLPDLRPVGAPIELPSAVGERAQLVHAGGPLVFLHGGGRERPSLWIDLDTRQVTVESQPEVRREGTVFSAPFAPGAVVLIGGVDPWGEHRSGGQLLRPGQPPEPLGQKLIQPRRAPVVVSDEDGAYLFGGTALGRPVVLSERLHPAGARRLPDLFGAVVDMRATRIGPQHIVLTGGVEPDGLPSALVQVLQPGAAQDGLAFALAARARELSQQVDADLARAAVALEQARLAEARARSELADAQQALADLQAAALALRQEIDRLRARVPQLEALVVDLQRQLGDLQAREQQLRQQGAQQSAERAALQTQLQQVQGQLTAARAQLAGLRASVGSLSVQLGALTTP